MAISPDQRVNKPPLSLGRGRVEGDGPGLGFAWLKVDFWSNEIDRGALDRGVALEVDGSERSIDVGFKNTPVGLGETPAGKVSGVPGAELDAAVGKGLGIVAGFPGFGVPGLETGVRGAAYCQFGMDFRTDADAIRAVVFDGGRHA